MQQSRQDSGVLMPGLSHGSGEPLEAERDGKECESLKSIRTLSPPSLHIHGNDCPSSATPILCRRPPGKRKENSIVVQSKMSLSDLRISKTRSEELTHYIYGVKFKTKIRKQREERLCWNWDFRWGCLRPCKTAIDVAYDKRSIYQATN